MEIQDYCIRGDIRGAIEYMRAHAEYAEALPAYTAIFENEEYRTYEVPEPLNRILRQYQVYFRDVFYCRTPEPEAAARLLDGLRELLSMPGAEEDRLVEALEALFAQNGFHTQFGDTQGYYGPYIWRETVPTTFRVELPDGTTDYTVNVLKGFVFRSWMDYLTFGRHGTGGWASKDGTINCVEQAYDFESERFRISFLKHEAQHTVDMKVFPGITPAELEYRAKLAELIYYSDASLLRQLLAAANEDRATDSHGLAAARLKREYANVDGEDAPAIQARALELFRASTKELREKYG